MQLYSARVNHGLMFIRPIYLIAFSFDCYRVEVILYQKTENV